MGIADYLALLRKRWVTVLIMAIAGLVVAGLASFAMTPTYQATAQVFVSVRGDDTTGDLAQGNEFTVKQVKSYTELVKSPRVLEPVIEELGLDTSPSALAKQVSAESPLDTVLINITVSNEEPDLAASAADAIADSLATVVSELEGSDDSESPVQISTVRPATVPDAPASPNTPLNLAIGLVVGLLCGLGIALLREVLDTRVRTQEDVRATTDAPIIGTVGFDEEAPDRPLIVQESPQSPRAESFRRLRTNLQFLALGDRKAVVMVSAIPGEGKTTTCINLAIALADAGTRVLLIDADLRRPAVARYLGIEGSIGLTTVLIGKVALSDATQPWGNANLQVLPAGQVPPNPSELLGSDRMVSLLASVGEAYDLVLLDTAPLLPVTDGTVLAKLTGGAVVVVGAGIAHRPQLEEALDALHTVNAQVLGLVVNRLPANDGAGQYSYDYRSDDVVEHREESHYRPRPGSPSDPLAGHGPQHRRPAPAEPEVEVAVPSAGQPPMP